jgi:hypothetical protein
MGLRGCPCLIALRRDTHVADQLEHGGHVLQLRHIAQHHGLVGQQSCAQFGQSSVLGARNQHLAV